MGIIDLHYETRGRDENETAGIFIRDNDTLPIPFSREPFSQRGRERERERERERSRLMRSVRSASRYSFSVNFTIWLSSERCMLNPGPRSWLLAKRAAKSVRAITKTLRTLRICGCRRFSRENEFSRRRDCVTFPDSTFRRGNLLPALYIHLRPSIPPRKELSSHFQNRLRAPPGDAHAFRIARHMHYRRLYSSSNIPHKGHSCVNPIPNINRGSRGRAPRGTSWRRKLRVESLFAEGEC